MTGLYDVIVLGKKKKLSITILFQNRYVRKVRVVLIATKSFGTHSVPYPISPLPTV